MLQEEHVVLTEYGFETQNETIRGSSRVCVAEKVKEVDWRHRHTDINHFHGARQSVRELFLGHLPAEPSFPALLLHACNRKMTDGLLMTESKKEKE